jgi:WD40 repeat protein
LIVSLPTNTPARRPLAPSIIYIQSGQRDRVNSVPYSPDGQILAAGSRDNTVMLRQSDTGALIRKLKLRYSGGVNVLAFSPDGQLLAGGTAADNLNLNIWRVSDGVLLNVIAAHRYGTTGLAFTPDGQTLITGGRDGKVKFWRVSDGALIRTLNDSRRVLSLALSPDGQLVASGGDRGTIKIWRVADGSLVKAIAAHTDYILALAFSPDGQALASGSSDNTLKIWRASSGTLLESISVPNEGTADALAFTRDGQTVIAGTSELLPASDGSIQSIGAVRFYSVSDGSLLLSYDQETSITVPSVSLSPDGSVFSYGRYDGKTVVARSPF